MPNPNYKPQRGPMNESIRKVRSMESVCLHGIEWKWSHSSRPQHRRNNANDKASKFSFTAQKARFNLPPTPESSMLQDTVTCNKSSHADVSFVNIHDATTEMHTSTSHSDLSRHNSVSSLSGLDVPQPDGGMTGPIATLVNVVTGETNIRTGALLNLIVCSLLLFATVADVAFRTTSQPSYYKDEPVNEVLYPPYGGDSPEGANIRGKIHNKKGLLGSAMISSVTDALGPVLPFAGGVDLRRDENWKSWSSWLTLWENMTDEKKPPSKPSENSNTVRSIPRGGDQTDQRRKQKNAGVWKGSPSATTMVLSATDPFLPADDIAAMTLREVTFVFHYAVESGAEGFDAKTFMSKEFEGQSVNGRMIDAVNAIENASALSRGEGVSAALTSPSNPAHGNGNVDALKFCAAMRLLAEWRVLRQIPPGFKGYAVGMSLGHKDVVQNVAKIETAVHEWIEDRYTVEQETTINSPTLRQILQREIDNDVHPNNKLPRLSDKSAAMGLLWVRRQMQYQTVIFNNIISVPDIFPTAIEAVASAYTEVYGHLHGWTVQKIFNYSFQSAPDADLIFRHMNPERLIDVQVAAASVETEDIIEDVRERESVVFASRDSNGPLNKDDPFLGAISPKDDIVLAEQVSYPKKFFGKKPENHILEFFSRVASECDKLGKHIEEETDKITNHIGGEWDKVVCNVSKIFQKDNACKSNNNKTLKYRGGDSDGNVKTSRKRSGLVGDALESYITEEMASNARQHILVYLRVAVPILDDLAKLFDEMNMNDPTKV